MIAPNTPEKDIELINAVKGRDRATIVLESVVEYAVTAMAYGVRKFVLKREISCMLFGADDNGSPKQLLTRSAYEKIRRTARAYMRQRSTIAQEEARDDSFAFYEEVKGDDDAPWAVRIRAQENLDKNHGIAPPDASAVNIQVNTVRLADLGLDLESRKAALANIRAAKETDAVATALTNKQLAMSLDE